MTNWTRHDQITSDLCEEIDFLREQVAHYKDQAEYWRQAHGKLCADSIQASQKLMGGMLVLAIKGRLR